MEDFSKQYEQWKMKQRNYKPDKKTQTHIAKKNNYHLLIGIIAFTILSIFGIITNQIWNLANNTGEKVWWWLLILVIPIYILITAIFIKGMKQVDANEIGAILRFGKPLFNVSSGFIFVPFPRIWTLQTESKLITEEHFPISENDKPIKITHGTTTIPTNDPLDTRLTTSVSISCTYQINDYSTFIQTIGNKKELRTLLRELLVSSAIIECSKFPLSINLISSRREEINYLLKKNLIAKTSGFGIDIISVQLQEIDLGNEIDKAQTSISVSAMNISVNKNNAQKILFDGAAQSEVYKAFQYAKAEGIKKISTELGIDDKAAMYQIETLANIWRKSNADISLYGNDIQQLFSIITSFYKNHTGTELN